MLATTAIVFGKYLQERPSRRVGRANERVPNRHVLQAAHFDAGFALHGGTRQSALAPLSGGVFCPFSAIRSLLSARGLRGI